MLFDFTNSTSSVDDWTEVSDTEREVGKSKGLLIEQKTQQYQRAIFFSLLNPQPNGAGFAGVIYRKQSFDLSSFTGLKLSVRAQGENYFYKMILRHHHEESSLEPSYENFFEVRTTTFRKKRSVIHRLFSCQRMNSSINIFHLRISNHIVEEKH